MGQIFDFAFKEEITCPDMSISFCAVDKRPFSFRDLNCAQFEGVSSGIPDAVELLVA